VGGSYKWAKKRGFGERQKKKLGTEGSPPLRRFDDGSFFKNFVNGKSMANEARRGGQKKKIAQTKAPVIAGEERSPGFFKPRVVIIRQKGIQL